MTKHENLAYFDGAYGHLTIVLDGEILDEYVTTGASEDRYIRIDDGQRYPQLCVGGGLRGNTLAWASATSDFGVAFARDCHARLFKTRAGYERAKAKLDRLDDFTEITPEAENFVTITGQGAVDWTPSGANIGDWHIPSNSGEYVVLQELGMGAEIDDLIRRMDEGAFLGGDADALQFAKDIKDMGVTQTPETWFWVEDERGELHPMWGTRAEVDKYASLIGGYNRNALTDEEIAEQGGEDALADKSPTPVSEHIKNLENYLRLFKTRAG